MSKRIANKSKWNALPKKLMEMRAQEAALIKKLREICKKRENNE